MIDIHNLEIGDLVDKAKHAIRISSTDAAIVSEIEDTVRGCLIDLKLSGVKKFDTTDALIIRAVTTYTKAEFGYPEKADQFRLSYNLLKQSMRLSGDYNDDAGGADDGGVE